MKSKSSFIAVPTTASSDVPVNEADRAQPEHDQSRVSKAPAPDNKYVEGFGTHARAVLRRTVNRATDHQKDAIAALQLKGLGNVIKNIRIIKQADPQNGHALTSTQDPAANQALLYVSSYCSLGEEALQTAVAESLRTLGEHLGAGDVKPPREVTVFYQQWFRGSVMIDVAVPTTIPLQRRPLGPVRSTVMPVSAAAVTPHGGVRGLQAARRLLARKRKASRSDPLFRVWQTIAITSGCLPSDWLKMPVSAAQ